MPCGYIDSLARYDPGNDKTAVAGAPVALAQNDAPTLMIGELRTA